MTTPFDEAIILDTETTDRENGEVIELAWVTSDDILNPAGAVHMKRARFLPSRPSTFGALATHHILDEELVGCPPSSTARDHLPPARYWIGHNIDFDWLALGAPQNVMRICTLALARKWLPDADSHSLSALIYLIGGRTDATRSLVRNAHGAHADVLMTQMLLHHLLKLTGIETLVGLYVESEDARVPRKWSFGKFEGQPISAADRGYAAWFLKNCRDRPDYQYFCVALKRVGLMA